MLIMTLLTGCNSDKNTPTEPIQTDESTVQHADESVTSSEDNQADPNQPPKAGMVRSLLTNEWVDSEIASQRPIAVMTPNEARAIPHYNLSKASVIYEAKVEGRMTRMMAIYEDWHDLKKIGNVRSLRSYFAYWAFEWDSIIVHYGGPYFIYDLINQKNNTTIDGIYDSAAFFRTQDRESPHNAYVSGSGILESAKVKKLPLEYRGETAEHHFLFADTDSPNTLTQYGENAKEATYIDMTQAYPVTRCYFKYDESTGLYYRYQYLSGGTDGPHKDAYNDEQLHFSNILVQRIKQEDIGNGYLAMQCHDTTRDGWFFTMGRGIHVTWSKTADYDATRFYDDNGNEITLNTGKTMILVIDETDGFVYH